MISNITKPLKAATQLFSGTQPILSGVKISCDGLAKPAWREKASINNRDPGAGCVYKIQFHYSQIHMDDMNP